MTSNAEAVRISEPITVWSIIDGVRQRRLLAAAGLLITLLWVIVAVSRPGVYFQEASLLFIAPAEAGAGAALRPQGLVSVAGLVAREVDTKATGPTVVSPRVTIVDLGLKHGVLVRLPNEGGQFSNNFSRDYLDVQVVGSRPSEVKTSMAATVRKAEAALSTNQQEAGVPEDRRIRIAMVPSSPPVEHMQGSSTRAATSSFILGSGLTLAVVTLLHQAGTRGARHWLSDALRARKTTTATSPGTSLQVRGTQEA